ncbi:VOC family protein [Flavobacterium difficile]|uniref:VOC family protein n=1 Tax=Flavobacterium difficile TaxID=2709659 RepID=A0ABX0I4P9_9FLAO|nr:VOC family protein [Flavobacterium difficile]NHM02122.1 VOC family protein [Flavobacterium difficile]
MATISTYLTFNGTTEAAFNFYKSVFGGEFTELHKFNSMPPQDGMPALSEEEGNRIMHVSFPIGTATLFGSDTLSTHGDVVIGNNFSISINAESKEEADKLFNGLSADGKITMPMESTFWGAYFGMFTDKFGINWMINFDEVPQ